MGEWAVYVKESDIQQGLEWLTEYPLLDESFRKVKIRNSNGEAVWYSNEGFITQHESSKKVLVEKNPRPINEDSVPECLVENQLGYDTQGIRYPVDSREQKEHFEALLRGYASMGYVIELFDGQDNTVLKETETVLSLDVFGKHRTLLLKEYRLYGETHVNYIIELFNSMAIRVPKESFIKQPLGVGEDRKIYVKIENETTESYGYNPVATLEGKKYSLINKEELGVFEGELRKATDNGFRVEVTEIDQE